MTTAAKPAISSVAGHLFELLEHWDDRLGRLHHSAEFQDMLYLTDTFVGRGMSGTIAAWDLARRYGKFFVGVRKPHNQEQRYSTHEWEGQVGHNWVMIDDFIATGDTFKNVYATMNSIRLPLTDKSPTCVGVFEYSYNKFIPFSELPDHAKPKL